MKFLVIGLGSMGKRRIRCLKALGENDIIGFDIRKDRCEEVERKYGIKTFSDFQQAEKENPDVFIISVPSNFHHFYAMKAYEHKKHFFTESNFLSEGIDDLIKIEEEGGIFQPEYSVKTHEEMYIEEIDDFLKALKGEKEYPYSFKDEKKIIDILVEIEKNAKGE